MAKLEQNILCKFIEGIFCEIINLGKVILEKMSFQDVISFLQWRPFLLSESGPFVQFWYGA